MESAEIERHLERARRGDRSAVGALLDGQRDRLGRMVALRLDPRLRGRVDAADVLQDAFLEASRRFEEYLRCPTMPFYLWLRFLAVQRLQSLYREHLMAKRRDARREVPLREEAWSGSSAGATSEALAAQLLGKLTTPSQAAMRSEIKARLREALESMDALDRETIALRHFEHLGNSEVAQVLGLDESAASKRYVRAIRRLREILARIPGMSDYPWR